MRCLPRRVRLDDPLEALTAISRDPSWKWVIAREDGRLTTAIEVQRCYVEAAAAWPAATRETDWVIQEWADTLDLLEKDPMTLADRLDWVAKRKMLETYREAEGVDWQADVLQSLDMEYHNIDPERGLYHALVEMGEMRRVTTDAEIERATREAPTDTRAFGRSRVIRALMARHVPRYAVDWDGVVVG